MNQKINVLLQDSTLDKELKQIAKKVACSERISDQDALLLYQKASLGFVGILANYIREKKHGDVTYFNRNFHVEPTNICIYTCTFCSYSRLMKKRSEGWEYNIEQILDIVKSYDNQAVTEVHIVGGVLPQYDFQFYVDLFRAIKQHRPELHIKGLTPVEYHYVFKRAKISYEAGMKAMVEAGLDSMPGGGAEIFHPEIHRQIARGKCTADQWLEIHEILHKLGKPSNATMLYGHIESHWHRVDHLSRLRTLQDKTKGFRTFIPLKFRNKNNQLSHLDEVSAVEDLKNYAISRIYLDNFDHIKAYWPMIGRTTAQLSLAFGVNDMDGTIDDTTKIYSMAGSEEQNPSMNTPQLVAMIKAVNRHPIERDTVYNVVHDYAQFDDAKHELDGFLELPVLNNQG
jgi:aminodeoxyfutalosine synthase